MKQFFDFTPQKVSAAAMLLILTMLAAVNAFAQTTAFTYQGKLTDGSNASPSGVYDMHFRLYDSPGVGVGTQSGGVLTFSAATGNAVNVSNGVFTVLLDFNSSPFATGANRYLEISVKHAADSGYTILSPREQITASPFSIRTLSASAADSLSTACVGCVTNAQIGTISGSKVTGSVANATNAANATTANTATTAGNVTGVVAIANGGTGSSAKNFVDLTSDQTVDGKKTFNGTLSGDGGGLMNVARFTSFDSFVSSSIAANATAYVFVSSLVPTITVTAGQRITASGSAALGMTSATVATARLNFCYQPSAGGAISDLGSLNYQSIEIGATRIPYAVSNSAVLPAGSYKIGLCLRNTSAVAINRNDYATGWIMVTNN